MGMLLQEPSCMASERPMHTSVLISVAGHDLGTAAILPSPSSLSPFSMQNDPITCLVML